MADPADIERRLATLRDRYGEFPVESGTYHHSTEAFERVLYNHERGVPGASRVWVERETGDGTETGDEVTEESGIETLLVRTRGGLDGWGVAGGLIEPDEESDAAAERELREETGIECEVVDVAYVHIAEHRLESERRGADEPTGEQQPIEELAVAFVARYVDGEIDIQDAEIRAAEWWRDVPEESYPPASRLGPQRL